jgi:hypothetical protein
LALFGCVLGEGVYMHNVPRAVQGATWERRAMKLSVTSDPQRGREGRRVESFEVNAFDDRAFF